MSTPPALGNKGDRTSVEVQISVSEAPTKAATGHSVWGRKIHRTLTQDIEEVADDSGSWNDKTWMEFEAAVLPFLEEQSSQPASYTGVPLEAMHKADLSSLPSCTSGDVAAFYQREKLHNSGCVASPADLQDGDSMCLSQCISHSRPCPASGMGIHKERQCAPDDLELERAALFDSGDLPSLPEDADQLVASEVRTAPGNAFSILLPDSPPHLDNNAVIKNRPIRDTQDDGESEHNLDFEFHLNDLQPDCDNHNALRGQAIGERGQAIAEQWLAELGSPPAVAVPAPECLMENSQGHQSGVGMAYAELKSIMQEEMRLCLRALGQHSAAGRLWETYLQAVCSIPFLENLAEIPAHLSVDVVRMLWPILRMQDNCLSGFLQGLAQKQPRVQEIGMEGDLHVGIRKRLAVNIDQDTNTETDFCRSEAMYLWARFLHFSKPVPTREAKLSIGSYCGRNFQQVSNWFTNYRARRWRTEVDTLKRKRPLADGSDPTEDIGPEIVKYRDEMRGYERKRSQ